MLRSIPAACSRSARRAPARRLDRLRHGRGGTLATVTDANVVLGIIDPDNFLGGRMKLESVAAERAVGAVADRLGIKLIEAAYAIHTTCNHNMVGAIENITVNEGIDPRESYLVSGGGATACHIAEMANVLGIKRFLVPKLSAALSAFGGLVSDLCFTEVATAQVNSVRFDLAVANELLIALAEKARSALGRAETPVAGRRTPILVSRTIQVPILGNRSVVRMSRWNPL